LLVKAMAPTSAPSEMDKMDHLVKLGQSFAQQIIAFLPSFAGALFVLVLGCTFIKCFVACVKGRLLAQSAKKKEDDEYDECSDDDSESGLAKMSVMPAGGLDPTLVNFGMSIVDGLMKTFLVIAVFGMIGIKTTSIIAIFTASTLAVGLALKGLITDLANGVMLIIFRPFVQGDHVKVAGRSGRVVELSMFRTIVLTVNNVSVFIPSSKIEVVEVAGDKNLRLKALEKSEGLL